MKRLVAVLGMLLVLPAFAEVRPVFYEEDFVETDASADDEVAAVEEVAEQVAAPVMPQSRVNPRAGAVSTRNAGRTVSGRATNAGVGVRARTVATPAAVTAKGTGRSTVATRGTAGRPSRATSGQQTNQIATTRRTMQSNNQKGVQARASIVATDTVNKPLYNGRVGTRVSSVRARIPTSTALISNNTAVSNTSAADAVSDMDELAQMTDYCKAQYTSCMDNYCNVLDDNQGRCSCSKNIKNYVTVENALKEAGEELQDVAQQIQYIGLSADDIETLFSETEAELQMTAMGEDSTTLATDLDNIKKLLLEPKEIKASASSAVSANNDVLGLLNVNTAMNVDSTLGGLWMFDFGGAKNSESASINNQRGEQLYNTAKKRCTTAVLNSCMEQGVNTDVVSNAYDMEIDKQCVAYERSLKDANDAMNNTVRNAKNVLQRARLLVRQQKNAYDLRGCVTALDSCMQDEFVCGADYENCLDPSGRYIVNGAVVVGSTPGQWIDANTTIETLKPGYTYDTNTLHATWNYTDSTDGNEANAWLPTVDKTGGTYVPTLAKYIESTLATGEDLPSTPGDTMSSFLQYKIGYHDNKDGRNYGMCMSVLNKCQDITYDKGGAYIPNNPVVREYLQRTLTQIKVAQDEILADYAENCISDVSSCLSQNNYNNNNNIAMNACRQQIVTCMSVNGDTHDKPTPDAISKWVSNIQQGGS